MNLDERVIDVLRRHAPGLLLQPVEDMDERRQELRDRLAEVDATDLARVQACQSKVQACEARLAELMAQHEAAEVEAIKARGDLSDARDTYFERRDATWKALEAITCETLASFRRELEGRLADLGSWSRTWPDRFNKQIGAIEHSGNASSVDAYAQALLQTRTQLADAIHKGLDDAEAEAAIAAMRAKWPQVQVGAKEYVTPTWQRGADG